MILGGTMGLFDKLTSSLSDNPLVRAVADPIRDAEAKAGAMVSTLAEGASKTARTVAEQFVEPEVVDEAIERAQDAAAALQAKEREVATNIAASVTERTGMEVSPEAVMRTGRAVLMAAVTAGVADGLVGAEGLEAGAEGLESGGDSLAEAAVTGGEGATEVPPVLYDGMGNMDGTVTITDGGMAIDS